VYTTLPLTHVKSRSEVERVAGTFNNLASMLSRLVGSAKLHGCAQMVIIGRSTDERIPPPSPFGVMRPRKISEPTRRLAGRIRYRRKSHDSSWAVVQSSGRVFVPPGRYGGGFLACFEVMVLIDEQASDQVVSRGRECMKDYGPAKSYSIIDS